MFWIAFSLTPITLVLFFVLNNILQKRYFEYDYSTGIYHLKYTEIKKDYFLKALIFLDLLLFVLSIVYIAKEIYTAGDVWLVWIELFTLFLGAIIILVFLDVKRYVKKDIIIKHINEQTKTLFGISYTYTCKGYANLIDGFPLLRPSGHFPTELFKKTKIRCFSHNYINLVYMVIAFYNAKEEKEYSRELLEYCLRHIDDDKQRRYLYIIKELNSLKARAEQISESKQERFYDSYYYDRERKVALKLLGDDNEHPHSALFYCQEIINEIESETEEWRSKSELEDYKELLEFKFNKK